MGLLDMCVGDKRYELDTKHFSTRQTLFGERAGP